jgi:serine protease Do
MPISDDLVQTGCFVARPASTVWHRVLRAHTRLRTSLNIVQKFLWFAPVLLLLCFAVPIRAQNGNRSIASLTQFSNSLRDLSGRISPSVVQINGTGYGLAADAQHGTNVLTMERSTGSGVILSDDGYIMTNAHVVESVRTIRVKVTIPPNTQPSILDGKLIGTDRLLDLALLKVEASGLRALPFGNSIDLKQGEVVLAFGSPLGMDNSVSMGIVSSPARQLSDDDPRIFVQTDAPINPGNSGGPLVDSEGRLVGMNTFILSQSGGSEGIGFAIPSNVIRYAYTSFKRDGHVHRGQIGIFARTITPALASAFGLEAENGVLVEDVIPGGPAGKAGIEVGDVVLSMSGTPLRNVRDLSLQLYEYIIGNTVQMEVLRNQKKFVTTVTVTESRSDPQRFADRVNLEDNLVARLGILGLAIDDTTSDILPELRLPDGVLVAAQAGSPAYFGDRPHVGDIIHAVNGRRISSVAALRSELNRLKPDEPLVLQVERESALMFLVLETN